MAMKDLDKDVLKSTESTRFADVKKRTLANLGPLHDGYPFLELSSQQYATIKEMNASKLKAVLPGGAGYDIRPTEFSSVANGRYILCRISYLKDRKSTGRQTCEVLMDRNGNIFDPMKTDCGKALDFLGKDNAWMVDLFREEDWPMVADLLSRLTINLEDSASSAVKQLLVPMLPGAIRRIRAQQKKPGEIGIKDLMRELQLDKYANHRNQRQK